MSKTLSVAAIKNGTVIDHIPSGQALRLIDLLHLKNGNQQITIGLHLKSSSHKHKDLIKIEERFLSEKEIGKLAIFAPQATINEIRNYKVIGKTHAQLPGQIEKVLQCPNLRCITRHETIDSLFLVESFKQTVYLRCFFCEKHFQRDLLQDCLP